MNAIVEQMKSEIEALIKERDEFKAAYYSAEKCASDLSRGCAKLQTERDAAIDKCDKLEDHIVELTSEEHSIPELRNQLQNEFEEKRKCYFAISQLQKASRNLVKEHDDLKAAGKLALDALYTSSHYTSALPEYHLSDFEVNEAITALRQAGVK